MEGCVEKHGHFVPKPHVYFFSNTVNIQGPVASKNGLTQFNPGLKRNFKHSFLAKIEHVNTVVPLLCDTVMMYTKCYSKQCIGR